MQALGTEIFIEMQSDLAVRTRPQSVARALELVPNCLIAIEFTVNDDTRSTVLARNRLISGRQINDAQPRMPKSNPPVRGDPMSLSVGSTVMQALRRSLHYRCRDRFLS
jgi:hypothetical protein